MPWDTAWPSILFPQTEDHSGRNFLGANPPLPSSPGGALWPFLLPLKYPSQWGWETHWQPAGLPTPLGTVPGQRLELPRSE